MREALENGEFFSKPAAQNRSEDRKGQKCRSSGAVEEKGWHHGIPGYVYPHI